MSEAIKDIIKNTKNQMQKALEYIESDIAKIRAGKAMPTMLDGLSVNYYGSEVPINQVSNINTPDARTILIQPFEKSLLDELTKVIRDSDLGFNPQSDGTLIRINVPPLTEERRKTLVKNIKSEAEKGRISIRNIRKDMKEKAKKMKGEGVSEDALRECDDDIQKTTNSFISKIDDIAANKEREVMSI